LVDVSYLPTCERPELPGELWKRNMAMGRARWLRSGYTLFKKARVGYDFIRKGGRLDYEHYLLPSSTCFSAYTVHFGMKLVESA
jgi:hypothetical protein